MPVKYLYSISDKLPGGYYRSCLQDEIESEPSLSNFLGVQIDEELDLIAFIFDDPGQDPLKNSAILSIMSQHDASACELEEAKDKVKESINALRYTHFFKRFEYDSSWFDCGELDYENIQEAIEAANMVTLANHLDSNVPAYSQDWILEDDTTKTMTFMDWLSVTNILSTRKTAIWFAASAKKAEVEALMTVEACEAYDIHSGWP